jgi:hypothetical protein
MGQGRLVHQIQKQRPIAAQFYAANITAYGVLHTHSLSKLQFRCPHAFAFAFAFAIAIGSLRPISVVTVSKPSNGIILPTAIPLYHDSNYSYGERRWKNDICFIKVIAKTFLFLPYLATSDIELRRTERLLLAS